jgi:hypothetical protein
VVKETAPVERCRSAEWLLRNRLVLRERLAADLEDGTIRGVTLVVSCDHRHEAALVRLAEHANGSEDALPVSRVKTLGKQTTAGQLALTGPRLVVQLS